MNLIIRDKSRWVNYLHDMAELKSFIYGYVPETKVLIGDLSGFNKPMLNVLLKFLEENPDVDCYSSEDISDEVLVSRFSRILKAPLILGNMSVDEFLQSDKNYMAAAQLGLRSSVEMRMVKASNSFINLLSLL